MEDSSRGQYPPQTNAGYPSVPYYTPGPAGEEGINLRHYWQVMLERRWLIAVLCLVSVLITLVYYFNATKLFQSTARLQIDKEMEDSINFRNTMRPISDEDYMVTQYKNLKSRTLIESVIAKLKLDKDQRYAKEKDKAWALMNDITVSPIRLSRLIEIKVQHPSPQVAADISNTLLDIFIQNNIDMRRQKALGTLYWLKVEADTLEKDVERDYNALQQYKANKGMVSLEESENIISQALKQAQLDLDHARSEATVVRKNAESMKQLRDSGMMLENIPQIANDLTIQRLQQDLIQLQNVMAGLLKRYKHKWPLVIETQEKIDKLKSQIAEQSSLAYDEIQAGVVVADSKVAGLLEEVRKKEKASLDLSQMRIQYDVLMRKAEQSKILYNMVLQKVKETDLLSKDKLQNMTIIDRAVPANEPFKPRFALTLIMGIVGGFGLAVGAALLANYFDDSIKSQDDIENYLGLPFLGYVPNIKTNSLVERDLQAHLYPQSNAAESFRTLRAAIALMPGAEKFQVIALTSTTPSEGKSLTSSNLAIVSAQTGLRTLLVDADLRRPSVHKAFQLQSPLGLSSYLSEAVYNVDELIHTTEVPNLEVVCCGAVPVSPSELVSSRRMVEFLHEMRSRYDRIILDCPPITAVSDPLVVASMSDCVVYVTKFNKVRREHVKRSIQRLQSAGIRILGVVLNDIDFEGRDSYYYSHYYYQNRYYASHYSPTLEKPSEPSGIKAS